MLHIVASSPFTSDALASCLRLAQPGSSVLLIENGVLAALAHGSHAELMVAAIKQHKVYALTADLAARAVTENILTGIQLIDYDGFVELVTQHNPIQNWD